MSNQRYGLGGVPVHVRPHSESEVTPPADDVRGILRAEIDRRNLLEAHVREVSESVMEVRTDVIGLRGELTDFRAELAEFRNESREMAGMRKAAADHRSKVQLAAISTVGIVLVAVIGAVATVGSARLTSEARGQSAETARQEVAKTQPSQEQLRDLMALAAKDGARMALRERDQQIDRLAAAAP